MIAWIKRAARATIDWLRRAWPWLRWLLAALLAVYVWKRLRTKLSALVPWAKDTTEFTHIPGIETHVIAKNPDTGEPETVELPPGVKASDVAAVGITSTGGYEVETLHVARDRRAMLRDDD